MIDLINLYERLEELKAELLAIAPEDWREFKQALKRYQDLRAEYVRLGGCMEV